MVFTFLFEISDLWRHLAIFFNIFKIKPNVPFIGFSVKNWIILTILSQNSSFFFELLHELIESIWKEFLAKIPVWDWPLHCDAYSSCNLWVKWASDRLGARAHSFRSTRAPRARGGAGSRRPLFWSFPVAWERTWDFTTIYWCYFRICTAKTPGKHKGC